MEFLIPITLFLMPVLLVFVHKHFKYKEKLLEAQSRGSGPPLLPAGDRAATDKRLAELEERLQNLESIIVAMDTDRGVLDPTTRDELKKIQAPQQAAALPPKSDP
jgi:hypothetical protein